MKGLLISKKSYTLLGLFVLILILNSNLTAQSLSTAKELYNNKLYKNSLAELNKVIKKEESDGAQTSKTLEEAKGYKVLCSILLGQSNLEGEVADFQQNFPSSPLNSSIKLRLAGHYFDNEEFAKAIKYYNSINENLLSSSEKEEYNFKKGYSLFELGNINDAKEIFSNIITENNGNKSNISATKFFLGYIHYLNKNFDSAIDLFNQTLTDMRFATASQYYILDCKYMLKDYDYVIDKGIMLLNENNNISNKIARIISESYYAKDDIEQASNYYNIYILRGGELTDKDYYFGGMLAYSKKDYKKTIEYLERFLNQRDSLAQSANYHLAECYIKSGNKSKALEAFKVASELKYDPIIKEDALFNYAKLRFDITGEIDLIEQYLNNYIVSQEVKDEIYRYIATNAVKENNYDQTIAAINNITDKAKVDYNNLKIANLFKGEILLNKGAHHNAENYFKKATENPDVNKEVTDIANLLLAECSFRDGEFAKSLMIIKELQEEESFKTNKQYPYSYFNSGYNYFKLKDFTNAENNFETYLTLTQSGHNNDNPLAEEAKIRISDCRFMMRDYTIASRMYQKIISNQKGEKKDIDLYPHIQLSISQGLEGKILDKITTLKNATTFEYKRNKKYTEALYELCKAQLNNSQDKDAIESLYKLTQNPPDSIYFGKALLDLGMISTNHKFYTSAIEYYQRILQEIPYSPESEAAINALENIYNTLNRPEEFLKLLQKNNLTRHNNKQAQEELLFNAIQQIYLSEKYDIAVTELEKYTQLYPNGKNSTKAIYYTAECYMQLNNNKKAALNYSKVIKRGETPYLENSFIKFAELCYNNEQYEDAIEAYKNLERITKSEITKTDAILGLVYSYYKNKEFENTISKSNELFRRTSNSDLKDEALYYKGKSLIALENFDDANIVLKKLGQNPNSKYGAEARYLAIVIEFDYGNYEKVENLTFDFAATKSPYRYWLAKSFIILGDSYKERGNNKQARATYESVKDNYNTENEDDDIIKIVTERIETLKDNSN